MTEQSQARQLVCPNCGIPPDPAGRCASCTASYSNSASLMTRQQFEDKRREPMTFGVVKWFNAEKGFGFIAQLDGGEDVFVHFASIVSEGYRSLIDNQRVRMRMQQGVRGGPAPVPWTRVMRLFESPRSGMSWGWAFRTLLPS